MLVTYDYNAYLTNNQTTSNDFSASSQNFYDTNSSSTSFTNACCSRPNLVQLNELQQHQQMYHHYPAQLHLHNDTIKVSDCQVTSNCPQLQPETPLHPVVTNIQHLPDGSRKAYKDDIIEDERVLENLLKLEERYAPSANYFNCIQKDIQPYMRKTVTQWMHEVITEQGCMPDVYFLSVNYLDRFLSIVATHRSCLQLVASVCMFIASKFREAVPLTAEKLVAYTDYSITKQQLLDWEVIVLARLRWDLCAITPSTFLDIVLSRLHYNQSIRDRIAVEALDLISLLYTEYNFLVYPPSMITCACLLSATRLMYCNSSEINFFEFSECLQSMMSIDQECLQTCHEQIMEFLRSTLLERQKQLERKQCVNKQASIGHQPLTPTDVRDVQF